MNSTPLSTVFDSFCGESFWTVPQVLASNVPRFNDCFLHTILVWIPVGFLWLFAPLLLYRTTKSTFRPLPWTPLLVAKVVISVLLAVDALLLLIQSIFEWINADSYHLVRFVCPLLLFLSMINATCLIVFCQRKGVITSGTLFLSWTVFCICGLPEFYAQIYDAAKSTADVDTLHFVCYMVWYPLICIQTILHAFVDKFGEDHIEGQNQSKELNVSFLSRITYWWVNGIVLTGHRRTLESSDLPQLNQRDTSTIVVSEWSKFWPQSSAVKRTEMATQASRKGKVGTKSNISTEDTPLLAKQSDEGAYTYSRLFSKAAPDVNTTLHYPSLAWTLCRCNATLLISTIVLDVFFVICHFTEPQLLSLILGYIEQPGPPVWVGLLYSLGLFGLKLAEVLLEHQRMYLLNRSALKAKSMLTAAIFSKSLRLSSAGRKNRTIGEIVNLMSVDVQKFYDFCTYSSIAISAPLELVLSFIFLYIQLGFAMLTGVAALLLILPYNMYMGHRMKHCQAKQMQLKDERLKLMNEILSGIKVLKLYAWEKGMVKLVSDIRAKELLLIREFYIWNMLNIAAWYAAPFLVSICSFGTFVLADPENNILTPQVAFVSLTLFNILRFPLASMPNVITALIQLNVSSGRISSFLKAPEIDPTIIDHQFKDPGNAILIRDGSFVWDPSDHKAVLRDVNLEVPKGHLLAVVGQVGSGKSSLLSALLGELTKTSGYVGVQGSVAYVPQQAWIQNMSLRENIVFGQPFDQQKYDKVIEACCLKPDFDILPAADATEIGEKGINLSGGQKARVSLARAVYSDADIYLLDDPLSAVDSHVGKHIFEHVLSGETGLLKDKTRILVTHGLTYLKHADNIVVLIDGKMSENGPYEDLMRNRGDFAQLLEDYLLNNEADADEDSDEIKETLAELEKFDPGRGVELQRQLSQLTSSTKSDSNSLPKRRYSTRRISTVGKQVSRSVSEKARAESIATAKQPVSDNLIEEETSFKGRVKFSIYIDYLRSFTWLVVFCYLAFYAMSTVSSVASSFWLAAWTDASSAADSMPVGFRISGYGILGFGQTALICASGIVWAFGIMRASRILHDKLLDNLMHSPMHFFDTTPLGRILNRVGKDIDVLDEQVPNQIYTWIASLSQVAASVAVIIISTPLFIVVILPMAVIFILILRFYVSTSRQLRRLESVSRSPVLSHFQETLAGAASIRAYNVSDRFVLESERRVDANTATMYLGMIANRWLGVRLEFLSAVVVILASIFATLMGASGALTAGVAGLSITYALDVGMYLIMAVREASGLETDIVAVERVKEYSETPQEAAWESEEAADRPPESWPDKGAIEFRNFTTRYRDGLELVLRGISARILAQEKVGIVGRTGAGKSSLTLSLFRIIEAASGEILIDGRNISAMGLHELRSKLTIIPQDPVLFSGTLRLNLDPFERQSDDEMWTALKRAHLKEFVQSLPDRLEHHCSEGGENLSLGQRQLLCLARALLRKTRILVLDEATAAVDLETDALVQKTIRQEFHHCTIVTIAHRLNTILDNDRVMVLDEGKIVELSSPQELLGNKQSIFYSMAKSAGLVS